MGKYRRGGYIFITWRGDHPPKHVHVFKNGRLVLKWNLEDRVPMKGKLNARLRGIIEKLVISGKL